MNAEGREGECCKYEPRAVRNVARNERNPSSESESVHTCRFPVSVAKYLFAQTLGPELCRCNFSRHFPFLTKEREVSEFSELDKYLRFRSFFRRARFG